MDVQRFLYLELKISSSMMCHAKTVENSLLSIVSKVAVNGPSLGGPN